MALTPLTSLTTNAGGTTTIGTASTAVTVATSGTQTYGDAVSLLNNTTLSSTGRRGGQHHVCQYGSKYRNHRRRVHIGGQHDGTTTFGGAVGTATGGAGEFDDECGWYDGDQRGDDSDDGGSDV